MSAALGCLSGNMCFRVCNQCPVETGQSGECICIDGQELPPLTAAHIFGRIHPVLHAAIPSLRRSIICRPCPLVLSPAGVMLCPHLHCCKALTTLDNPLEPCTIPRSPRDSSHPFGTLMPSKTPVETWGTLSNPVTLSWTFCTEVHLPCCGPLLALRPGR